MSKRLLVILAATLLIPLSGCATSKDGPASGQPAVATPADEPAGVQMGTARVRFSTGNASIVVRMVDNPTSRTSSRSCR